ncbi:MAG: DUF4870 domain-containing protein [Pseudoclavibacter sp.]|nr:DUF4870 domain-containing protein [Pseudoclavibacter sp.]
MNETNGDTTQQSGPDIPGPASPAAQQPWPVAPISGAPHGAQPAYGAPEAAAPHSPPHLPSPYPPYAAAVPGQRPPTGGYAWGLGFLSYLPIPLCFLFPIVLAFVYRKLRRSGSPVAAENGRNALNWGITFVLVCLLSYASMALFAWLFHQKTPIEFIILPLLTVAAAGVTHVVFCIMGLVRAARQRVFAPAIAIPFVRAPKPSPQQPDGA